MIECAVVIGPDGPIHWHLPPGRTGGSIPDSRELWDVLWEHRKTVVGVAHTHPGSGLSGPSWTDLTTFVAVEAALGRSLLWWIVTSDCAVEVYEVEKEGDRIHHMGRPIEDPPWADALRKLSEGLTIEEVFGTPEQ